MEDRRMKLHIKH